MQCPKCKAEVSGKFCRQCGTAVTQPVAVAQPVEDVRRAGVCPSCGAGVRPEQKFCPKCAEPLGGAVARVAAPALAAPPPTTGELCWQCGSELKPGAKFCNSCGRPSPAAGAGRAAASTAIEAPAAVERAMPPFSAPVSPPASSAPFQAPPIAPTTPQFGKEAGPRNTSATAAFVPSTVPRAFPERDATAAPLPPVTRPVPRPLPPLDSQRTPVPGVPAVSAGSAGNQKAILFAAVAVLGLAFGGLTYWYVLRKPTASSAPSKPSVSQTATPAADKPSPGQSTTPAADTGTPAAPAATTDNSGTPGQSTTPAASATDTTPAASDSAGAAPAKAEPARSADTAPRPAAGLSGFWEGEYTNAGQASKVTLQISKDSAGLLAGTMVFDDGGNNPARCTVKGAYNPQSKFMVLQVAKCKGQPPAYLEGKIGFASVEPSARQAFGVDSAHNSFLNISRQ
jgi:hypothetical protein